MGRRDGTGNGAAALERLASLVNPGEKVFILQATPIATPSTLRIAKEASGVQMVGSGAEPAREDGDAAEMLALATLTEPGPFVARTHVMGDFFGIRAAGRLVAMAGERMRFPGYTEVSGVCTHPDYRGRGYARRLSAHVASATRARGEIPFLHAWKTNAPAIRLYEGLGFEHRCDVHVAVLAKESDS